MLFISLPRGQNEGDCTINGAQVRYRIEGQTLAFRHDETEAWDVRRILDAFENDGGLTSFICSDGDDTDEETNPEIITPRSLISGFAPPVKSAVLAPNVKVCRLPVHKEFVAEAVHQAVCEYTGTDGCQRCMYYALTGSWLLSQITGRSHMPQVGSLRFLAEPPDGWIEIDIKRSGDTINSVYDGQFHAWIATCSTGSPKDPTFIDLTTRHFKKLSEKEMDGETLTWSRPDPPTFLWAAIRDLPDWICLQADEDATKFVWKAFTEAKEEWRSLMKIAFAKYQQLLERDSANARRTARRSTKKAERRRRRKSRR